MRKLISLLLVVTIFLSLGIVTFAESKGKTKAEAISIEERSDFELEFNAEDITALNYGFDCLDVTLSDGRQITHWTDWLGDDVTE